MKSSMINQCLLQSEEMAENSTPVSSGTTKTPECPKWV